MKVIENDKQCLITKDTGKGELCLNKEHLIDEAMDLIFTFAVIAKEGNTERHRELANELLEAWYELYKISEKN